MALSKLAKEIFRDFTTEGVPSSGVHEPIKPDVRAWGTALEAGLNFASAPASPLGVSSIPAIGADGNLARIDPYAVSLENDLRPLHAGKLLAKSRVRVVLAGDSLTTGTAVQNGDVWSGLAGQLTRWLKDQFPEKAFDFFYRGLGGMRYYDLNTIVAPQPFFEWTVSPTEKWCETIAGLNPDLIILSFGMNDGQSWDIGNFQPDDMMDAISIMRKAKSRPDIWLCTNLKPSSSTADTTYSSAAAQEGRDVVAGYTRSLAKSLDWGLLDFNRWMNVAREGRDVCDRYLTDDGTATAAMPLNAANDCRDFVAKITVASIPSDFFNPAASGQRVRLNMGPSGKSVLHLYVTAGFLTFEYYPDALGAGNVGTGRIKRVTEVAPPAAGQTFSMDVVVVGTEMTLSLQGTQVYSGKIVRYGGKFKPSFGYSDNRIGPTANWRFYRGVDLPAHPVLDDRSMWSGTGIGGNGLNHPNTPTLSKLYTPVLSRLSARGAVVHSAAARLHGRDGLAFDFVSGQYALSVSGILTTGTIDSIVGTWIGGISALPAYVESGFRTGVRLAAGTGAAINVAALWGASIGPMAFSCEAKSLTPGTASYFAAMARVGDSGPRSQFGNGVDGNMQLAVIDDASALALQTVLGGVGTKFVNAAVNEIQGDYTVFQDGRIFAEYNSGNAPSGLTHLKLGHIAAAGNTGDIILSSIVIIPGASHAGILQAISI